MPSKRKTKDNKSKAKSKAKSNSRIDNNETSDEEHQPLQMDPPRKELQDKEGAAMLLEFALLMSEGQDDQKSKKRKRKDDSITQQAMKRERLFEPKLSKDMSLLDYIPFSKHTLDCQFLISKTLESSNAPSRQLDTAFLKAVTQYRQSNLIHEQYSIPINNLPPQIPAMPTRNEVDADGKLMLRRSATHVKIAQYIDKARNELVRNQQQQQNVMAHPSTVTLHHQNNNMVTPPRGPPNTIHMMQMLAAQNMNSPMGGPKMIMPAPHHHQIMQFGMQQNIFEWMNKGPMSYPVQQQFNQPLVQQQQQQQFTPIVKK